MKTIEELKAWLVSQGFEPTHSENTQFQKDGYYVIFQDDNRISISCNPTNGYYTGNTLRLNTLRRLLTDNNYNEWIPEGLFVRSGWVGTIFGKTFWFEKDDFKVAYGNETVELLTSTGEVIFRQEDTCFLSEKLIRQLFEEHNLSHLLEPKKD